MLELVQRLLGGRAEKDVELASLAGRGGGESGGEDERILIYTQWLAHVEHVGALLAEAGHAASPA